MRYAMASLADGKPRATQKTLVGNKEKILLPLTIKFFKCCSISTMNRCPMNLNTSKVDQRNIFSTFQNNLHIFEIHSFGQIYAGQ